MAQASTIAGYVKAKIEEVSNVGNVYDYIRWTKDWAELKTLFQPVANGSLKAWMVSRRSTDNSNLTFNEWQKFHQFQVIGIYSLDDSAATEKDFQDLIDEVCEKFLPVVVLSTNPKIEIHDPADVDIVETRMFGPVLCHYCEITIPIKEFKEDESKV